jgi:hypothetical protein
MHLIKVPRGHLEEFVRGLSWACLRRIGILRAADSDYFTLSRVVLDLVRRGVRRTTRGELVLLSASRLARFIEQGLRRTRQFPTTFALRRRHVLLKLRQAIKDELGRGGRRVSA